MTKCIFILVFNSDNIRSIPIVCWAAQLTKSVRKGLWHWPGMQCDIWALSCSFFINRFTTNRKIRNDTVQPCLVQFFIIVSNIFLLPKYISVVSPVSDCEIMSTIKSLYLHFFMASSRFTLSTEPKDTFKRTAP